MWRKQKKRWLFFVITMLMLITVSMVITETPRVKLRHTDHWPKFSLSLSPEPIRALFVLSTFHRFQKKIEVSNG